LKDKITKMVFDEMIDKISMDKKILSLHIYIKITLGYKFGICLAFVLLQQTIIKIKYDIT
jgi:hypothetical protein